jgi:hypothetical protein
MTPEQLDALQAAAMKRLIRWINRSAAQHLRQMKKGHTKCPPSAP